MTSGLQELASKIVPPTLHIGGAGVDAQMPRKSGGAGVDAQIPRKSELKILGGRMGFSACRSADLGVGRASVCFF